MAATLHDPRYKRLIALLIEARTQAQMSQEALSAKLGRPQSFLGKIETLQRRLDALELLDLVHALDLSPAEFAKDASAAVRGRATQRRRPT